MTFEEPICHSSGFTDKLIYILYLVLGVFVVLPGIAIYFTLAFPFFLYYHLITFLISKCFRRRLGFQKMVAHNYARAYAIELISSISDCRLSLNTITSSTLIEGIIPFQEFQDKITNNWLRAKNPYGQLQYPELSTYIDSWMGYAYWRKDENFSLSNHLKYHQLESNVDLDSFTIALFEQLFNKPYPKYRSPWEVHVIHGWKTNTLSPTGEKFRATVFVTKSHHALGDGLSIMCAVVHGIVQQRLLDLQVVSPALTAAQQEEILKERQRSASQPFVKRTKSKLSNVVGLLHDFGVVLSFIAWRAATKTRFHVPDNKKSWKLNYERSSLISMEKVKRIKNHFGVKFSSVLLSCVSAGISHFLNETDANKNFLMFAPRPLPTHAMDKMVNQFTGVSYKLCVTKDVDPVKRLRANDRIFRLVSGSLVAYMGPILQVVTAYFVIPIARQMYLNWAFPGCLSNMAGPRIPVMMRGSGNKILEVNAAVGPHEGVMGLVFLAFSYDANFYLNALAENACLSKSELEQFMAIFENEIEHLYQLTLSSNKGTGSATLPYQVFVPLLDKLELGGGSGNPLDPNANDL